MRFLRHYAKPVTKDLKLSLMLAELVPADAHEARVKLPLSRGKLDLLRREGRQDCEGLPRSKELECSDAREQVEQDRSRCGREHDLSRLERLLEIAFTLGLRPFDSAAVHWRKTRNACA